MGGGKRAVLGNDPHNNVFFLNTLITLFPYIRYIQCWGFESTAHRRGTTAVASCAAAPKLHCFCCDGAEAAQQQLASLLEVLPAAAHQQHLEERSDAQ